MLDSVACYLETCVRISLGRYDEFSASTTQLDPLEDAAAWIHSLRSQEYTLDVLKSVHGFSHGAATNRLVRSIQTYATNALGFLDQAYSGPAAVSFLPLYYVVLNLSKISIIASGSNTALNSQRWHGASYPRNTGASRSLLTDDVVLHRKGAFPLLYKALVGRSVGFKKRSIMMRDIYPYVSSVTYEYTEAFKTEPARQNFEFSIEQRGAGQFRLEVQLKYSRHADSKKLRYLKAISGFRKVPGTDTKFVSKIVKAKTADAAQTELVKNVTRYLLYGVSFDLYNNIQSVDTPVSSARLLMPEELPIWIALFHLSSVVRYNPEFLDRLQDSRHWPVLLSLRKHSILRYLILFWSHLHQKTFMISVD